MRAEFAQSLVDLAERDERVVLLTGDLGFAVLEPFSERFPERFFNVGVAEQNMVGVATGLAEAGFVPFCYSIATFATLRPYEFIRNGPVLHQLPVRIVGVGGGFDYGPNGITHYALEDLAVMRAQPGLAVAVPADVVHAQRALAATESHPGPIYFRVGRDGPPIEGLGTDFELGRASVLGEGGDVAIVAVGTIAGEAVRAAEQLAREGLRATVTVVESFNPGPDADLVEALGQASLAVTVEEHYVNGGLGSYVAELIADRGLDCRLIRRGVERMPRGVSGSQASLREANGLSAAAVAKAALEAHALELS